MTDTEPRATKPFYRQLYAQVLAAVLLGVLFGAFWPAEADRDWVKALGDGFVKLVKLTIPPIVFCTMASGIAQAGDAKKLGRVGFKALVYFEVVSTFALLTGLAVGAVLRPGDGFPRDAQTGAPARIESTGFFARAVDAFPDALHWIDILYVVAAALLFGVALLALGQRGASLCALTEKIGHAAFVAMGAVMTLAPLGAFGAMAFTVAHYGVGSLRALGWLVGSFYLTSALFVLGGLGLVAKLAGFSILRFLVYIKDELLIVVGASSSEAALPRLMEKLERLGCSETIVGLVTPTGYSFNLDGTNIYMSLATMFIAQALGIELTALQQATIIGFAMISSKGASGVSGAGYVTLAATLAAVDPRLSPGLALTLGVDKFMRECRALTNVCGNGVATVVIAAWEGELDRESLRRELRN